MEASATRPRRSNSSELHERRTAEREGARRRYRVGGVDLPAFRDVSFDLASGEILGLVGESGSGKSTAAAAILRILARNGRITSGTIDFGGRDLGSLAADRMRSVRGAEIAMIFQDPLGSLNPTMPVGRQLLHVAASHPGRLGDARSRPARESSTCSAKSASPTRRNDSITTPISSRAACASGS